MTVYESMGDRCREIETFQRTPAAFVEDILGSYTEGRFEVNHDQVGKITFPDITPSAI